MNRFKGFLICTDCDGTLTDSEGKLSKENEDAIKYFQKEGGLFTLATGRFPDHVNLFKEQISINAPIVSLGGTVLFDVHKNQLINKWTMKKSDCDKMLSYVRDNWPQVWEYWLNYTYHDSTGFKPMEQKTKEEYRNFIDPLPDELYKIVIIQPKEVTYLLQKDLKKHFGDKFSFDTSWENGIEIQNINSGKGIAVAYLKSHLKENIHTTIGIGDYENDISLLKYADIGYAVDNALDSVKEVANRITVSNNESAIAKVIEDLEK